MKFPAFASMVYVPSKNGVVVSTRVPSNLFSYGADESITLTGVIIMKLAGSDHKLLAIASDTNLDKNASFQLKVNLAQEFRSTKASANSVLDACLNNLCIPPGAEKYRIRHLYYNNLNTKVKQPRPLVFVHFHKAGGTSMIQKFNNNGYQLWSGQVNGIPDGLPPELLPNPNDQDNKDCRIRMNRAILKFWQYSRYQFDQFLADGKSQTSKLECVLAKWESNRERMQGDVSDDGDNRTIIVGGSGVEFISLEWNFFLRDHFFEPVLEEKPFTKTVGQSSVEATDGDNIDDNNSNTYLQANMDMITIMRDPYDRFISNFYFNYDNPREDYSDPLGWAHLNLERRAGSDESHENLNTPTNAKHASAQSLNVIQYGAPVVRKAFRVNYNKPNYYTAFLNGLNENNSDEHKLLDGGRWTNNYDFDYFAFELNHTYHLELAKERLRTMFDAIIILERPETRRHLHKWFAFLGTDDNVIIPHGNSNPIPRDKRPQLDFTRDEFYKYNALDIKSYMTMR